MKDPIEIRGARTHNLQGIDCAVPPAALTVVTGVSGSGKSSLVFDTLYAEGQRRFVQSMSTYTRLFLDRMERPDVDFISNIPPAIALAQKNTIRNARSTVGTITEINDHLRLLWAHVGEAVCTACGGRVLRDDPDSGLVDFASFDEGTVVLVVAPLELADLPLEDVATGLRRQGYRRLWLDGRIVRLDEETESWPELPRAAEAAAPYAAGSSDRRRLPVVIDRLTVGTTANARAREALEGAFGLARGRAELVCLETGATRLLDRRFSCRDCGLERGELVPHLFSFNSPLGACTTCQGFGRVPGLDLDKVIPDPRRTLEEGAVAPWTTPSGEEIWRRMLLAARDHGVPTDVPWKDLGEAGRTFVLEGEPTGGSRLEGRRRRFRGVHGFFRWLEGKRYKTHVRILLARYRGFAPCEDCGGARLQPDALAVQVGGCNIAQLVERPLAEVLRWTEERLQEPRISARTSTLLGEVRHRLLYLMDVGLEYLTLSRQARTLSGGEAQRIHLASALGSSLTDTLYCLDEPTVGLHTRDSERLLGVLRRLTTAGNTVVVVEHDPSIIEGADHVLDLGPGGGAGGGRVQFAGPPQAIPEEDSATGRFLRARRDLDLPHRGGGRPGVTIEGARENNLRDVTVSIPHQRLVCVTGVSGSGKSTLVEQVLYNGWLRDRGEGVEAGACDRLSGFDDYDEVVLMSQASTGRSSRSNAATYLKAYDDIRALLAATPAAKAAGIPAGHFSFNASAGRCEECEGMGTVTIEMHFMADLEVPCERCDGARFKPHVLEVRYRGRNVNEILSMTVDEAREFFSERARIRDRFGALSRVGLGYLTLGQATSTLSGGEAQRLRLAGFLSGVDAARRLLLFDEPTTGLHLADVARLVGVLHDLVDAGQTVVVVEHNLDFVAAADWVIDLGPEGGDLGGCIVAEGTPMDLAGKGGTPTADALATLLSPDAGARSGRKDSPRSSRPTGSSERDALVAQDEVSAVETSPGEKTAAVKKKKAAVKKKASAKKTAAVKKKAAEKKKAPAKKKAAEKKKAPAKKTAAVKKKAPAKKKVLAKKKAAAKKTAAPAKKKAPVRKTASAGKTPRA